jgi:hypothetical protein
MCVYQRTVPMGSLSFSSSYSFYSFFFFFFFFYYC